MDLSREIDRMTRRMVVTVCLFGFGVGLGVGVLVGMVIRCEIGAYHD